MGYRKEARLKNNRTEPIQVDCIEPNGRRRWSRATCVPALSAGLSTKIDVLYTNYPNL